ncbi:hypothetical protein HUU53_00935 [Candidatus Micrarchaeota archaeon]|nr:hypothetical protein [Candidatus Micrarchaeota archaeon]
MVLESVYNEVIVQLGFASRNFLFDLGGLLMVLIAFGIGWLVAGWLVDIIKHFMEHVKFEQGLKKRGIHDALLGFTFTDFVTKVVKFTTVVVFLNIGARGAMRLAGPEFFLYPFLRWLFEYTFNNLLQGLLILVLALIAGDYITDRIKQSSIPLRKFVAWIIEAFIAYSGIVIALPLIIPRANVSILENTFTILLGGIALAIGLGFAIAIGLGLKDSVARVAKKKEREIDKLF